MNATGKVEIFSAGCPTCQSAIELVKRLACSSCEGSILAMTDLKAAKRAQGLGVRPVPAVAVEAGLGQAWRIR